MISLSYTELVVKHKSYIWRHDSILSAFVDSFLFRFGLFWCVLKNLYEQIKVWFKRLLANALPLQKLFVSSLDLNEDIVTAL